MSRNVTLHGGVNTIQGDVYILEVHGGVINLYGRAGAINQFGGVLNDRRSSSPGTTTKIVYRDRVVYRDKIVYRDAGELSDGVWIEKITRLENEHEAEVKNLRAEIALLKERLQGALDAYHNLLHPTADDRKPYPAWDEYKPTKAECEAVYKNFKVWLECEQELEPINL
jgi:hypothetical protein